MSDSSKKSPGKPPVGIEAYRLWEELPRQKLGVRAYLKSTYDRTGNNDGADGGHFLYQESDTFNVALDEKGPGCLYFVRTNHFHGSPWHYEVDSEDFVLKETCTDDPVGADRRVDAPRFIPEALFPPPLNQTWRDSQGGDLMATPIPFEDRLRIAYERTFYGTGYYIVHKYPHPHGEEDLKIQKWDRQPPHPEALQLLEKAGTSLAPAGARRSQGSLGLGAGEAVIFETIAAAPAMVRAVEISVPEAQALAFGACRLKITWDGSVHPSVDAPLAMFFGVGHLFNKTGEEYLMKGLMANVRYGEGRVHLACYWPMPFFSEAGFSLENTGDEQFDDIQYTIASVPYEGERDEVAYFHATYTDTPHPEEGRDVVMLDTDTVEGGGPWCGSFVGLTYVMTHSGRLMLTVEGDPRFYFDDSETPQAQGTGTEELAGGGDHWRWGQRSTLPLYGHPVGRMGGKKDDDPLELINSAYRFFLADHFPFGKRALVGLEHGPINDYDEHYEGCAYWYGVRDAGLVQTDEIAVCNDDCMAAHKAVSVGNQAPYILTSRFDKGPHEDFPCQREYYSEESDLARTTAGHTEFEVALDPENVGVMLRRKFDYWYNNQTANVYVAENGGWAYAGQWYSAGCSTTVYSRPTGKSFTMDELKPTEHHIIPSDKRWREEEFLIATSLTAGKSRIRIKIEHVSCPRQLFPGEEYPSQNLWSECRYTVYSYRRPRAVL